MAGPDRAARRRPVPAAPARCGSGAAGRCGGCAGGIYGIGGGSILAPVLIGSGREPAEVAPAALAATFVTSVAGVVTFVVLSAHGHGTVAPDWPTGIALGAGGLAGAYTGARLQSRLPDTLIRRLVGIAVIAVGARYLWAGLASGSSLRGFRSRPLPAGRVSNAG
ncbi:MAG TPA: TSUP family transporter, partial [Trebonia sp.]